MLLGHLRRAHSRTSVAADLPKHCLQALFPTRLLAQTFTATVILYAQVCWI